MVPWQALLKKDFRLTMTVFFVGLAMNVISMAFAVLVGKYQFIPFLFAASFHVFYLPIMLFVSLRTEAAQLHIWLHHPRSAAALLLSKLLSGVASTVASLAFLYAMAGILAVFRTEYIEGYWTDAWKAGWLLFLHAVMISVVIGVWVILLWTLYHALKYRIGRWTWVALIGAVVFATWIDDLFTSTNLYRTLTQWGSMEMGFPTFGVDPITVFAGDYLYHLIVIIGIFYVGCWIMDRKVEV